VDVTCMRVRERRSAGRVLKGRNAGAFGVFTHTQSTSNRHAASSEHTVCVSAGHWADFNPALWNALILVCAGEKHYTLCSNSAWSDLGFWGRNFMAVLKNIKTWTDFFIQS